MSQENEDKYDSSDDESIIQDDDEDDEESYKPPIKIEKTVNNIELELDDIDAELDSKSGNEDDDEDDDDEDDDEDDDDDEERGEDADIDYLGIKEDAKAPFSEFANLSNSDDDEDDDSEDGNTYLQKLDTSLQQQIISDFHPELKSHNNNEIEVLSRVVRDENGVIIDPLHKTLPFITRYEKARILGERAKQLNSGAKPFVEIEPSIIDGYLIALKEYEQKKIPFIIKRPIPNGGIEYWKFEDLEMLD
jgi:DNA-directed RNA polymerase I, II, and III subunit RPABC2|uniref:DNA-directed RNA polymerase n=1 Tax=viral metagenome TaxID=1070528 RepID=A0A6C0AS41_9ZZZZ